MSDTPHLVEPGDEEGFALSRFISVLGIEPVYPGTFFPGKDALLAQAWKSWTESTFLPLIVPAFIEALQNGLASRVEEICGKDRELSQNLPEDMAVRSQKAAQTFLEGKSEMKGNREWVRYAEAVESGTTPGNLPVVFALQSALFHLPLASALSAYAWFEFQSRHGKGLPPKATAEEKSIFAMILPKVAVAVKKNIDDSGGEFGSLRAI
ncbi:MAG: hypothetical protein P1U87_22240 [Verrucomicrobiales bacterium]|nr:hypothetical protein [Verrucomicrobiales bacterium]